MTFSTFAAFWSTARSFRRFVTALILAAGAAACAQTMPHIEHRGNRSALIVDGAPYLMLGVQINNSSAWASQLPAVWPTLEKLHANTLEAPVYWEQVEPAEHKFDFSSVDLLLDQAREHHIHLVLLWFGTWKNNSMSYTPSWVKLDARRFPRALDAGGRITDSLSPFGEQTLQADIAAFSSLMQHLRDRDPQHTVILVQVENEAGFWHGARDTGAQANEQFARSVPAEVLKAMGKPPGTPTWEQAFREDAGEYFYAWAIARYIEQVAAAGKRILPLPLYVNAALRDPLHPQRPPAMESGGPTDDVLPIWRAIAPSVDAFAPDIYMPEYENYTSVLRLYSLPWNPFFVPETGNSPVFAHYFFASLGAGAFGWSPFGMDTTGYVNYPLGAAHIDAETLAPFALNYRIVGPMIRQIAQLNLEDRVRGVAEAPAIHTQRLDFSPQDGQPAQWFANVSYGLPSFYSSKPAPGNVTPEGEALVAQLDQDEFLVTGVHCRVDFAAVASDLHRQFITVEEGSYVEDRWVSTRVWNGDQTDYGLNFTDIPQILRVKLMSY